MKRSPGASWSKYVEFQKAWNRTSWTMLDIDWMEMYPEMTLVNRPGNGYDLVHALMPLDIGPSLQEV